MKYAEPIISELLDFHGPWISYFEENAASGDVNSKRRISAKKILGMLRDYESAATTEMIIAMPEDPVRPHPKAQPSAPKHKKPHPWRSQFARKHKG